MCFTAALNITLSFLVISAITFISDAGSPPPKEGDTARPKSMAKTLLTRTLFCFKRRQRLSPNRNSILESQSISYDIDFLERQVQADLRSYSPKELSGARAKIARLKQRSEILKIELSRRRDNDSSEV